MLHAWELYLFAAYFGINLGSVQSYARTVYAQLIPVGKEAEMFSLFEMCVNFVCKFQKTKKQIDFVFCVFFYFNVKKKQPMFEMLCVLVFVCVFFLFLFFANEITI